MRLSDDKFSLTALADRPFSWLRTGLLANIFTFRFSQYHYPAEVYYYISYLLFFEGFKADEAFFFHLKASVPTDVGSALQPPERLHPAEGVDERGAHAPGMCKIYRQARVNPTACL